MICDARHRSCAPTGRVAVSSAHSRPTPPQHPEAAAPPGPPRTYTSGGSSSTRSAATRSPAARCHVAQPVSFFGIALMARIGTRRFRLASQVASSMFKPNCRRASVNTAASKHSWLCWQAMRLLQNLTIRSKSRARRSPGRRRLEAPSRCGAASTAPPRRLASMGSGRAGPCRPQGWRSP